MKEEVFGKSRLVFSPLKKKKSDKKKNSGDFFFTFLISTIIIFSAEYDFL